jgi:hypothetical protein
LFVFILQIINEIINYENKKWPLKKFSKTYNS